ncbi:hypothetical protein ACOMHN_011573 [Nucella lapillus]
MVFIDVMLFIEVIIMFIKVVLFIEVIVFVEVMFIKVMLLIDKENRSARRQAHTSYVSDLVSRECVNTKLWRLVNRKMCNSVDVAPMKKAGLTYSDPGAKANILNELLCSVFTQKDLMSVPSLKGSHYSTIPDIPVTEKGLLTLLQNHAQKLAGPDDIPRRLLHTVAEEITPRPNNPVQACWG